MATFDYIDSTCYTEPICPIPIEPRIKDKTTACCPEPGYEFIPPFPLIPNPIVLTKYEKVLTESMQSLGVSKKFVIDVVNRYPGEFSKFNGHILAIILYLRITPAYHKFRVESELEGLNTRWEVPKETFFIRQYTCRSAASIAVFHAVCNCIEFRLITCESPIAEFYKLTYPMCSAKRGKFLENGGKRNAIVSVQCNFDDEEESEEPDDECPIPGKKEKVKPEKPGKVIHTPSMKAVGPHFITYVYVDDCIYELDPLRNVPVTLGKFKDMYFVSRVCERIKTLKNVYSIGEEIALYALVEDK